MRGGVCAHGCSGRATGARASGWGLASGWEGRMRMTDTKPMQYRIVDRSSGARGDERDRVIAALRATPASVAPKYFYDELGCALHGAICRLPEHYPTRTDVAIFRDPRLDIAQPDANARQHAHPA